MVFKFSHPGYLALLALLPLCAWIYKVRETKKPEKLPFSRVALLKEIEAESKFWRRFFPVLRGLILLLLVLALAGPQWGQGRRDLSREGMDIVIALDVSGSMLALDFMPQNRLGAAVKVAKEFVAGRPNDRFSLIAFSEYAITASPLTWDHAAIMAALDNLKVNMEASGTAIGVGLAKAVARLRDSEAKSRIVILITDGVNNTGQIDPLSAADMAKALGIKVYAIGVGSGGMVPFPYQDPFFGTRNLPTLIELDMLTLEKIAQITGTPQAYKATDAADFKQIMQELDAHEKTEIKAVINYEWEDHFDIFLALAALLLFVEIIVKSLWMPILPE